MKMFVLLRVDTISGDVTLDPIGVYDSREKAQKWSDELSKLNMSIALQSFDFISVELNSEPIVYDLMKSHYEKCMDTFSSAVPELMENGIIEQYIGEDGNFYYGLTEEGLKYIEQLPQELLDFIEKKE